MAALRSFVLAALLAALLAGCDDLEGFGGEVPPLATIHFEVTGDFEAVRVPGIPDVRLRVAIVWGAQWLPEPLCFLPPESSEVEALVAAGCRDPLGFVPDRAADSVAIAPNQPGEISLFDLPSADVMVGDVTSRIAYAALVVFDDRNGTERLELSRSRNATGGGGSPPEDLPPDIVYGSSFVSMTEPDVRVVLREGGYNERAAFYPRRGCGTPAPGFSIVAAGGFTRDAAIAAALLGEVPAQDPATCRESTTEETVVAVPLRAPEEVAETGCVGRRADSSVRYRQPPIEPLNLTGRVAACAKVPDFGSGETAGIVQWVVSTLEEERCKGLTHYVLRGCDEDAACALPEWDITASPPAWWPCLIQGP
jgi:hypothetical protein